MKKTLSIPLVLIYTALFFSCKKDMTAPTPEKYFPTVKSIIQMNCLSCHSSAGAWSGRPTAFDTDDDIVSQSARIKAAVADPVVPGPGGNKRMPEGGMLSESDIAVIVKWFEKGGKATD